MYSLGLSWLSCSLINSLEMVIYCEDIQSSCVILSQASVYNKKWWKWLRLTLWYSTSFINTFGICIGGSKPRLFIHRLVALWIGLAPWPPWHLIESHFPARPSNWQRENLNCWKCRASHQSSMRAAPGCFLLDSGDRWIMWPYTENLAVWELFVIRWGCLIQYILWWRRTWCFTSIQNGDATKHKGYLSIPFIDGYDINQVTIPQNHDTSVSGLDFGQWCHHTGCGFSDGCVWKWAGYTSKIVILNGKNDN